MPTYDSNINDVRTITAAFSGAASTSDTVVALSGFTQHNNLVSNVIGTIGWGTNSIFTIGSTEHKITLISNYQSGTNTASVTISPALGSNVTSGTSVTRKFKGNHGSLDEHLRLRNLGHI